MKTTNKIFLMAVLISFLFSCKKDNPGTNNNGGGSGAVNSQTLLVGSEGSFGAGTASLTQINLDSNVAYQDVYQAANNEGLGDVLQSISRVGNSFYFIVNNSNKIVVTDTNFVKTAEISNVNQPRYMLAVNNNKAYVSSIYNYKIYVLDLASNTKTNEIPVDSNWTEEMVMVSDVTGNYVYTCNNDTAINYITKINANTDQVVDRITIGGYAPSRIVKTTNNTLWILAGNSFYGKSGTLTHVDPATKQIVNTIHFNSDWSTDRLAIDKFGDLFVLVNDYTNAKSGVYKILSNATAAPTNYFLQASSGTYLYGMAVDPVSNDIFISDAKDFVQQGSVSRYKINGNFVESWTTGVAPSSFYFVQ